MASSILPASAVEVSPASTIAVSLDALVRVRVLFGGIAILERFGVALLVVAMIEFVVAEFVVVDFVVLIVVAPSEFNRRRRLLPHQKFSKRRANARRSPDLLRSAIQEEQWRN